MRKLILFVLFLIALTVPVYAVGKVTQDPNKAGAVAEAPSADLKSDPKLAQKVTYTAAKKTVSAIIDDLSKSTGVTIRAGRNSDDWQVRDRKMNVYAKDVPLNELMNSIARVMKFKWEIGGKDGAFTYRLFMDRKSLLDAEAQRVRAEQKAAEQEAKRRQDGLMQYGSLHNMTPADMAKLKQDNPFMYFVANSGMGGSMSSFFSESPGALEAITTGQPFEIRGSALSSNAQAGLSKAMQQMVDMESKFGGRSKSLPADLSSNMGSVNIQINQHMDMIKGMPQSNMLLGEMSIRYKGGSVDVPMLDPESPMTKLIGKAILQSQESGQPMDQVMKGMIPDFIAAMKSQMKADDTGEAIIEHAEDPALSAKITLKADSKALPDVEQALADASKYAVVSDYFGGFNGQLGDAPSGDMQLKEALDKISDGYIYNWDKHSKVIELRDRNWFKKRAAQIPEAWLQAWRDELTKKGTLDIDSLAQMAALTQEQISVNLFGDDVLKSAVGQLYGARELLRLYVALSTDQRAMMFTSAGLPLRSLSSDQWAQAQKQIQTRGGGTLDFDRNCSITATKTAHDKTFEYKFSLIDGNKAELSSWVLNTPEYTPPAPAKDKAKPGDQKSAGQKPGDAAKSAPKSDTAQPK